MNEHKIVGWAIWYADESCYTSKDHDFEQIPRDGAVVMVTLEAGLKPDGGHKKNVFQGYDYYFRSDGIKDYIYGCDLDSRERTTFLDITERYDNPIIIRGKWTDRIIMQELLDKARSWQP